MNPQDALSASPALSGGIDYNCLHDWFSVQAERTPGNLALAFGNTGLTYQQLEERSNQLAHLLRESGVGPETMVALCLDRSLDTVVAILGVLKAGGAYVPIDLAYPVDRIAFMLADTRAPVLLTVENLRERIPAVGHSVKVICLDSCVSELARRSSGPVKGGAGRDNVAYVIYTSGSTGQPKGVLVTHGNVLRLMRRTEQWFGFCAEDVWTLFHSYTFDFSVWEMWGALLYGGRLVVVPYLVSRSPREFYELLGREGVTVLNQTPSAFRQLIRAEASAPAPLRLRYVVFGGEALELQSLKPWFDRHGDETPLLVNMYGITETTVHVTYRVIRKADVERNVGSVIGVPIPDLTLHLLDESLRPAPRGEPGEICVGGAGVARGYLNRAELTRERFVPDPFSKEPNARLYRSGDLARYTEGGDLEYLGRLDHQVKIRGFRIELGEIESNLNRHLCIRESVVIAQPGATGENRLVAYLVPQETAPTVTDLRQHLATAVPEYMIPSAFIFMSALPLTNNGKIDRRALPNPDGERPKMRTPYVAPAKPSEMMLSAIWAEVLGVDKVGVNDNFFELGGDSIRSIAVLSRGQQAGLNLSLEQLFANPTIAALALCAEDSAQKSEFRRIAPFNMISADDVAKLPGDIEDAYPVTELQLGMFYHNELNPCSAVYHDVFSFRIQSAFDETILRASIKHLVQRHVVLRTSFHLAGYSVPMQLVHQTTDPRFTFDDLRDLTPEAQVHRLQSWVEAEKRESFDRTRAPLLRFHSQITGEQCFQFIVSFHHAYLDGWSLAALLTEIFQEYAAVRSGKEPNFSPPRVAYREFVALEREAVRQSATREFWASKLRGATFSLLPRWPRELREGGHEQKRGREVTFTPEVLNGLKNLAQTAGVPLKTVLLAVHQHVMGLVYGHTDVTSGLISNGRPEEIDGEKMIGLFLNTVPVRVQLNGGSWLDLVKAVFAEEQAILPHRRFPLPEIQRLHGSQTVLETAFDFVHFHVYKNLQGCHGLDFSEGHYFEANNLTTLTTFALDMNSVLLQLHIDYDPSQLCRQQVDELTDYYRLTAEAMAADPGARYEDFLALSEPERQRLLTLWNPDGPEVPQNLLLHHLIAKQAERTPAAVALEFEGRQLTYAALEDRANRLARHLQSLGSGPERLVALCLERNLDLVVAIVAILKSGAAYLPLDPNHPAERIDYILGQAQAAILITERHLMERCVPKERWASIKTVCLSESRELIASQSNAPITLAADGRNLAYVLYTSGSTGHPKGVQIEHRSAVGLVQWAATVYSPEELAGVLFSTSVCFDLSIFEMFVPLSLGGAVIIVPNALGILEAKPKEPVTLINTVPSAATEILRVDGLPATVKTINLAGEPLRPDLVDRLYEVANITKVYDLYGPTEDTTYSTFTLRGRGEPACIGRPLANKKAYILDSRQRLCPVGTAGEICLAGIGTARGYLGQPELTAEKFIPNPFIPGGRMYRTGDLGRLRPDGKIEYLGRFDHQVKIRGFRIELGEIESVLRRHPDIREAVVVAREEAPGEKRLVAYLVFGTDRQPSGNDLREFLRRSVPDYMLPASWVTLEKLPLNSNGKVDRKALLKPDTAAPSTTRAYVPAQSRIEELMVEIWRDLLRVPTVGVEDNFFELGGDSLLATSAFARINRVFSMELPLREIFERPTIRSLGVLVNQMQGTSPSQTPIIPRRRRMQA